MTSALGIWRKLWAEQDFPWAANTLAGPTDHRPLPGLRDAEERSRDPRAGERSQYKIAQSLWPTRAGLTQTHLLPGDWPQGGFQPPPHPRASFLQQAPPPRESPSGQFIPLAPVGVVSDRRPGAALSQSPGTRLFFPGSELEGSSWPAVPTASRHGSQGETQVSWGRSQCPGGRWGRTADPGGVQPGGQNGQGGGTKAEPWRSWAKETPKGDSTHGAEPVHGAELGGGSLHPGRPRASWRGADYSPGSPELLAPLASERKTWCCVPHRSGSSL